MRKHVVFVRFAFGMLCLAYYSCIYSHPHVHLVISHFPSNFYEANEVYVQQTLSTLPSYWSMSYSKETQVTTVIIKGIANGCD
jgi:hypothetical protein